MWPGAWPAATALGRRRLRPPGRGPAAGAPGRHRQERGPVPGDAGPGRPGLVAHRAGRRHRERGGMLARTCVTGGQTVPCWYVDPPGPRAPTGGRWTTCRAARLPRERRRCRLRSTWSSGTASRSGTSWPSTPATWWNIQGRRQLGLNARPRDGQPGSGIQWFEATDLCDTALPEMAAPAAASVAPPATDAAAPARTPAAPVPAGPRRCCAGRRSRSRRCSACCGSARGRRPLRLLSEPCITRCGHGSVEVTASDRVRPGDRRADDATTGSRSRRGGPRLDRGEAQPSHPLLARDAAAAARPPARCARRTATGRGHARSRWESRRPSCRRTQGRAGGAARPAGPRRRGAGPARRPGAGTRCRAGRRPVAPLPRRPGVAAGARGCPGRGPGARLPDGHRRRLPPAPEAELTRRSVLLPDFAARRRLCVAPRAGPVLRRRRPPQPPRRVEADRPASTAPGPRCCSRSTAGPGSWARSRARLTR